MACSVCSANVERKLNSLAGINSATVSLADAPPLSIMTRRRLHSKI